LLWKFKITIWQVRNYFHLFCNYCQSCCHSCYTTHLKIMLFLLERSQRVEILTLNLIFDLNLNPKFGMPNSTIQHLVHAPTTSVLTDTTHQWQQFSHKHQLYHFSQIQTLAHALDTCTHLHKGRQEHVQLIRSNTVHHKTVNIHCTSTVIVYRCYILIAYPCNSYLYPLSPLHTTSIFK